MELTPRKYLDPSWLKKHEQYDDSFFCGEGEEGLLLYRHLNFDMYGLWWDEGGGQVLWFYFGFFYFHPPSST